MRRLILLAPAVLVVASLGSCAIADDSPLNFALCETGVALAALSPSVVAALAAAGCSKASSRLVRRLILPTHRCLAFVAQRGAPLRTKVQELRDWCVRKPASHHKATSNTDEPSPPHPLLQTSPQTTTPAQPGRRSAERSHRRLTRLAATPHARLRCHRHNVHGPHVFPPATLWPTGINLSISVSSASPVGAPLLYHRHSPASSCRATNDARSTNCVRRHAHCLHGLDNFARRLSA